MNKEAPTIEERIETADTETTDNLLIEEQDNDVHTSPDENNDTDEAAEPQIPTREPATSLPDIDVFVSLNQHLSELKESFEKQIARNQNQKQMFDAIYGEMKDYKENVLLEAFQKPIIHNLIQFYDNFVLVESQLVDMSETLNALGDLLTDEVSAKQLRAIRPKQRAEELPKISDRLQRKLSDFRNNMENVRIELEEVLYRMDVEPYEEHPEKLDRKLHKTLKTIPTDDPAQDGNVAAVHKTGFYWREAVFRPEEVTILRYTPQADEPSETVNANATEKRGD